MRHGECDGNVRNIYVGQSESPLTDNGRRQARTAAEKLAEFHIDRIVSSTLSRALDTAAIVAEVLGVSVVADSRLMEFDPGMLTGQPIDPKITWDKFTAALNHEDPTKFMERVVDCVKQYSSEPGNTLFVAHSGVSRLLNTISAGLPPAQFEAMPTLENGEIMTIDVDRLNVPNEVA